MLRSLSPASAVLVALGAGFIGSAHAASSTAAYALSAGGQSILGALAGNPFSCATFGPDPRAASSAGTIQIGLPTDGSICGVGVDARSATALVGGVAVASSLAVGFGAPGDLKAFVGDAAGRGDYGNLGVRAAATYSGTSNAFLVVGSQAFGRQTETMTFAGTGTGFYEPTFTIDGSLFGVGRGYSELSLMYSVGAGPTFLAFRILDSSGDLTYYGPGGYVAAFPGMTTTGDLANGFTVSGSTKITLDLPITFATATDITFSMWGAALPSSSEGLLTPSAGEVSFMSSAKLTGIRVLDASGRELPDFSIVSGSGTQYDRNGVVVNVSAVPEPGTSALLALGMLAMVGVRARRVKRVGAG